MLSTLGLFLRGSQVSGVRALNPRARRESRRGLPGGWGRVDLAITPAGRKRGRQDAGILDGALVASRGQVDSNHSGPLGPLELSWPEWAPQDRWSPQQRGPAAVFRWGLPRVLLRSPHDF